MRLRRVVILALCVPLVHAAAQAGTVVTTDHFGNLFHDGDTVSFTATVYAGSAPLAGTFETRVVDPYGRETHFQTESASVPALGQVSRAVTLDGDVRGLFEVTARMLAPESATDPVFTAHTTLAIVPYPKTPGLDERSNVGYFVVPTENGPFDESPRRDQIAEHMRNLGIKWVRYVHRSFSSDARRDRPDTTDDSWLDSAGFEAWVDAYRAHGISVLGGLFGSARWASTRPDDERIAPRVWQPYWAVSQPRLGDWDLYARTMVRRLRGRIDYWEIWNEPDGGLFYEPLEPDWGRRGEAFAALVQTSRAAIAAEDPGARLVVTFDPSPGTPAFEDAFMPAAGALVDVFGYHYGDAPSVALAESLFERHGLSARPFWNVEAFGLPANQLTHWIRQRAAGCTKSFPFVWNLFGDGLAPRLGSYPLGAGYAVDPLGIAVRTLSDKVGRAEFVRSFRMRARGLLNGYIFDDDGTIVIAIMQENPDVPAWGASPGDSVSVKVPRDTAAVIVTDLMGNSRTVEPDDRRRVQLPLDGNPVFVEGIDVSRRRPLRWVRR
jgi:hypothetical protein